MEPLIELQHGPPMRVDRYTGERASSSTPLVACWSGSRSDMVVVGALGAWVGLGLEQE